MVAGHGGPYHGSDARFLAGFDHLWDTPRNLWPAEARARLWLWQHPDARTIPPHIESALAAVQRHESALSEMYSDARAVMYRSDYGRDTLESLREQIEADSQGRAERCAMETALADYLEREVLPLEPSLFSTVIKLRQCHQCGTVGTTASGYEVVWDVKCGMVRLCPHEAREETQRLSEIYVPGIEEWIDAAPGRRVQYCVLTMHNFRDGKLRDGKAELFRRFKAWSKKFPQIRGSLVCQEDPLSADHEWNIHLNVLLLIDDRFDWDKAREEWGFNVHFQQIKKANLRATLLELVKYSAALVQGKGESKADAGTTAAPPMVAWPGRLWLQWWLAQKGFRRTRAYGCLYAIERRRWDAAGEKQRYAWLADARSYYAGDAIGPDFLDLGRVWGDWVDMSERERQAVRRAMRQGGHVEQEVRWIGSITFDPGRGAYSVDLIPGDNFRGGWPDPGHRRPPGGHGPPARGAVGLPDGY